ncbi:MAG: hypothetical protein ABSA82_01170 [Thermacetogeniaceae bacterium]
MDMNEYFKSVNEYIDNLDDEQFNEQYNYSAPSLLFKEMTYSPSKTYSTSNKYVFVYKEIEVKAA